MGEVLPIEPRLVPQPLWGRSGSQLLTRSVWRRIRQDAIDEHGGACVACGVAKEKGMVCDEVWEYEDAGHVATLVGLRPLCRNCDGVTHIGQTASRGYGDVALAHMAKVNGSTEEEARQIERDAYRTWRQRSQLAWTVAVAPALLKRYPDLAVLDGLTGEAVS